VGLLMAHRIIRSLAEFEDFVRLGRTLKWPQTLRWNPGADRSLDQNALQFKWAQEAAEQRGDMTVDEVRCEWKLTIGVPILRAENEDFRAVYDEAIKPLPYGLKLKAMRFLPVTSEMTVKQMREYLDTVQRECAEQGIRLTDPDARKAA
jgi:hypothetical protein